ncbi:MAG: hypothetical protein KDB80_04170, partial [Planctomycetes bacterium]|nr:hypothetical protein [Planctomycetota bacterium]
MWFRHLVPFTLLTTLLFVPYGSLMFYYTRFGTSFENARLLAAGLFALLLLVLASVVSLVVLHGLRGEPTGFLTSFGRGLRAFPTVLAAVLLVGLGVFGIALVSGLLSTLVHKIIGVTWFLACLALIPAAIYVAIPVIVVERTGAIRALRRSIELARGNALRILLIIVVVRVLITLANLGLQLPLIATGSPSIAIWLSICLTVLLAPLDVIPM